MLLNITSRRTPLFKLGQPAGGCLKILFRIYRENVANNPCERAFFSLWVNFASGCMTV
jgi:hypothetical protein